MKAYTAVALVVMVSACGRAKQQAAEARADSLQRVLRQDSLQDVRERARATAAKHRSDSIEAAHATTVAESLKAEKARPRDLTLFSSTGLTVASQSSVHYGFVLDSAADCLVHGRIEVQPEPATKSDVQVLLLTADDYTNWRNNANAQVNALYKGPQQTATTLNAGVTESGTYNLVISNRFSFLSKKTVKGQVIVTCHGAQPRPA